MRRAGFTLVEVMVISVLFLILVSALGTVVSMCLNYWSRADQRTSAERVVRTSLMNMLIDLRVASICPDPGTTGNPPRGYVQLSPAVAPTAVLEPNANTTTSSLLRFNQHAAGLDPLVTGFNPMAPVQFQEIRYDVSGLALRRTTTTFNTAGGVAATQTHPIAQCRGTTTSSSIVLDVEWKSPDAITITVRCTEGRFVSELSTDAYIR